MAHPRTLAGWEALTGEEALTAPERQLIEACREGDLCELGEDRPEGPDPARNIRAELLRWLILGGCDDCSVHEWGVQLVGAYIIGSLDLSFSEAKGPTALTRCRFAQTVNALQTKFVLLNFNDTALPGLIGQGIDVKGSVFLRNGFDATGEVYLAGARIGGQLDCAKGHFSNEGGKALNAQRIDVKGGVFLRDGFDAKGEVNLIGARIAGQLSCRSGCFTNEGGYALTAQGIDVKGDVFLRSGFDATGEINLAGARISGQLDCEGGRFANNGGDALDAQRMHVAGSFFWRNVYVGSGSVDLNSAFVGDLADYPESWPASGQLILDGFSYDRVTAPFTDAAQRLEWLAKGDHWNGEFFPQPYTQLAKVLREMGHERDARQVQMAQKRRLAAHIRTKSRIKPNGDVLVGVKSIGIDAWNLVRGFWDIILRSLTGYGHAPVRSLIALGFLFTIAAWLGHRTWEEGSFAPNSGVVLVSSGWQKLAFDPEVSNPALVWAESNGEGRDWETFNRYAYAFDLVVPILTLGQTDAWAPSTTRGTWGRLLWWARWVLSSMGWVVTALGAAAITGIIRRD